MTDGTFRGPQVCSIVGVTYRQLDYWARTNLVTPSVREASGSGTVRLYSRTDLVQLTAVKQLLDAGLSLQSVRQAVDRIRNADADAVWLVFAAGRAELAETDAELLALLGEIASIACILNLRHLVAGVEITAGTLCPA